jgi:hypothetical protein
MSDDAEVLAGIREWKKRILPTIEKAVRAANAKIAASGMALNVHNEVWKHHLAATGTVTEFPIADVAVGPRHSLAEQLAGTYAPEPLDPKARRLHFTMRVDGSVIMLAHNCAVSPIPARLPAQFSDEQIEKAIADLAGISHP